MIFTITILNKTTKEMSISKDNKRFRQTWELIISKDQKDKEKINKYIKKGKGE
jgi:hypothetical protein